MEPLARRERAVVRGGWTTHRHGAGLLQLRSLTSHLLLRSSSAMPNGTSHVRRGKSRQWVRGYLCCWCH